MLSLLEGEVKEIWSHTTDDYGSFQRDYQLWVAKMKYTKLKELLVMNDSRKTAITMKNRLKTTLISKFHDLIIDEVW